MERSREEPQELNLSHDLDCVSSETLALRALVDALFRDADKRTFDLYNLLLEKNDGKT